MVRICNQWYPVYLIVCWCTWLYEPYPLLCFFLGAGERKGSGQTRIAVLFYTVSKLEYVKIYRQDVVMVISSESLRVKINSWWDCSSLISMIIYLVITSWLQLTPMHFWLANERVLVFWDSQNKTAMRVCPDPFLSPAPRKRKVKGLVHETLCTSRLKFGS